MYLLQSKGLCGDDEVLVIGWDLLIKNFIWQYFERLLNFSNHFGSEQLVAVGKKC